VYLASHLWWVVENPQRGEEDPKNVSHLLSLYCNSQEYSQYLTALPRWKTGPRVPPTCPPCC
jgi:hypothetical protein